MTLEPRETWSLESTSSRRSTARSRARQAVQQRFGEERARVRESLSTWQLRVPQLRATLGSPRLLVPAVGRRPRVAAHARGRSGDRAPSGRGDAVVHDRVRPRHAHHVPADAPLRPGARAQRARGPRRAAGDRGRSVDRRGAGQDRARAPPGQGGRATGSRATTARSTRRRSTSSCSPRSGAGRTTPTSPTRLREPALARARAGSTSGATATGTASSSTGGAPSTGSRTRPGRTPATRSASATADRRRARSPPPRCRATSTTRSCAWPRSRARCGATASSPTGSSATPRS